MMTSNTHKWPDIEGFHVVVRDSRKHYDMGGPVSPKVFYKSKIKLDGTNAAVRMNAAGTVVAYQSRTQDVTVENDNAGFARWASGVQWPKLVLDQVSVIHGEWAGPGVQKGTACQQIPSKMFFIFAIESSPNVTSPETGELLYRKLYTDPEDIQDLLAGWSHPEVRILPWHPFAEEVNISNEDSVEKFAEKVNGEVLRVEACDPYIKETFGVEGVGEGIVLYPVNVKEREQWCRLAFKAKGEKHRVKAAKVAVEVTPEVLAGVEAFVEAFVTEARCEQGVTAACGGDLDVRKTGAFIGWVSKDVEKESRTELEASGLNWKQVSNAVTTKARTWYQKKATALT